MTMTLAEFEKIYVPVQPRHKVRAQAVSLSSSLIKERKRATSTPCTPASVKISRLEKNRSKDHAGLFGSTNSKVCNAMDEP